MERPDDPRCDCEPTGQGICGPHDRLEVVRVNGRDMLRRVGIDPCPERVAAILRAREWSERSARVERKMRDLHG